MESTPYQLQFDINNPDMYRRVHYDNLEVGTKYRFAFTKETFPEPVTVLKNEEDIIIINE